MWPFKRRTPSPEIAMAAREVAISHRRAQRELALSTAKLEESQQVCEILRAHNDANHYDTWLETVVRDFRR